MRASAGCPAGFRVFRGPEGVAGALGANVVAFGKFDGLHLGHRALLDRAAATARRLGLPYGAATFERHPDVYLRRGPVPPMLASLAEKLRLLRDAGAQFVVLLPADATVLSIPADQFARDVLRARMGVRVVVVGQNFRFGHRGSGGVVTLRELSSAHGLDGVEVGTVDVAGGPVSATRIRAGLARGDVELVRDLLGRPYEVAGALRALGPSAASVVVSAARAVPARGEYLGSFRVGARVRAVGAVVEVGKPDGGRHPLTVRYEGERPAAERPAHLAQVAFEKRL